jgi:nitrite reductase/ring-hydroxylating ferredoxin subunit
VTCKDIHLDSVVERNKYPFFLLHGEKSLQMPRKQRRLVNAPLDAMSHVLRLCHSGELAECSSRGFDPTGTGRDTVFIVRRDGMYAYRNVCPHWANTSMAWRKDAFLNADGTRIVCAAHGAQFDIATGVCLLGPCIGQSLTRVPLIESEDGSLHLHIEAPHEAVHPQE